MGVRTWVLVRSALESELETVNAKMLTGEGTERLAHEPSPVNRVEPKNTTAPSFSGRSEQDEENKRAAGGSVHIGT